jgi:hypothetical protein
MPIAEVPLVVPGSGAIESQAQRRANQQADQIGARGRVHVQEHWEFAAA